MLCPASCMPLLREWPQWRCLLGWYRHRGVGASSSNTAWVTANAALPQLGSEVREAGKALRPVCRTKPQAGSQYHTAGCQLSFPPTEKPEHEEVCPFKPYNCPCPRSRCNWQGPLHSVMRHLVQNHRSISALQGNDIVFSATGINMPGTVDWVMMQTCFGHDFMLVLQKKEQSEGHQQFFAVVLLIGSRKRAESFMYRLELVANQRRLIWEAAPRSIQDGVAVAIKKSDCLMFDESIAEMFTQHGNLGINVTISVS